MNTSNQTQQQQHKAKPAQATSKAGMARFALGAVTATPAALELLKVAEVDFVSLLSRHVRGDWGNADHRENDAALAHGFRLLSIYSIGDEGHPVWVMTDSSRSNTTLMTPADY